MLRSETHSTLPFRRRRELESEQRSAYLWRGDCFLLVMNDLGVLMCPALSPAVKQTKRASFWR